MLWFAIVALLVAALAIGVGLLGSETEAGILALILAITIVFGWQTFAKEPLVPWIKNRWAARRDSE